VRPNARINHANSKNKKKKKKKEEKRIEKKKETTLGCQVRQLSI
jgi:hypothetical protein